MQMHCDAFNKSLAQTVAKMSNPWWHKPARGQVRRRNGVNASWENEWYAKPLAEWGQCQRCQKVGNTRDITQRWLCEECQLRETASYIHSFDGDEQLWEERSWQSWNFWNTWQPSTCTENTWDWSTWQERSALMENDSNNDEWGSTLTNRGQSSRAKSRPRRGRDIPEQHTCEASESIPAPNLGAGATEPSGDATTCSSAATETIMCIEMIPEDVAREPREGSSLGSTPVNTHADTVGVDTTCDRPG